MPIPREQLRLTSSELDELMLAVWEVHVATVSPDGSPHVSPVWFVWHEREIWVNSLRKSRRQRDVTGGSPVAVCADTGDVYGELRGAVFRGRFVDAAGDSRLAAVRRGFGEKYWNGAEIPDLRSHVWVRLEAERVDSWDFRKIPAGRDRRLEAHPEPGR